MATSDYLKREEAAKKQLGAKGVSKRVKQLPTAARASLREMTGIDVSRRGVSIDPAGVAVAAAGFIPLGKIVSVASKASRAAKVIKKAPDEFVKPYQTRAQRKANPTYVKATSTTAKKQLGKYHSVDAAYERYLDSSVSGPKKTPKQSKFDSEWTKMANSFEDARIAYNRNKRNR